MQTKALSIFQSPFRVIHYTRNWKKSLRFSRWQEISTKSWLTCEARTRLSSADKMTRIVSYMLGMLPPLCSFRVWNISSSIFKSMNISLRTSFPVAAAVTTEKQLSKIFTSSLSLLRISTTIFGPPFARNISVVWRSAQTQHN